MDFLKILQTSALLAQLRQQEQAARMAREQLERDRRFERDMRKIEEDYQQRLWEIDHPEEVAILRNFEEEKRRKAEKQKEEARRRAEKKKKKERRRREWLAKNHPEILEAEDRQREAEERQRKAEREARLGTGVGWLVLHLVLFVVFSLLGIVWFLGAWDADSRLFAVVPVLVCDGIGAFFMGLRGDQLESCRESGRIRFSALECAAGTVAIIKWVGFTVVAFTFVDPRYDYHSFDMVAILSVVPLSLIAMAGLAIFMVSAVSMVSAEFEFRRHPLRRKWYVLLLVPVLLLHVGFVWWIVGDYVRLCMGW